MKRFSDYITLSRNSRGCYIIDTVKGCEYSKDHEGGCYGDCYALKIANRYKIDFGNPVLRVFKNAEHEKEILRQVRAAKLGFIRIGEMGDPSHDWEHTIDVADKIKRYGKKVVIITKHWKAIPKELLGRLKGLVINTSVSALDSSGHLAYRLGEFNRLKPFCESVLRIVTCDFNKESAEGLARSRIQDTLMNQGPFINTIFRPSKQNRFVADGVINVKEAIFLKQKMLASYQKQGYLGRCDRCPDRCGAIGGLEQLELISG